MPYAVALGLLVAILDLIPLAGATIAAILIGTVAFLHSIPAGIVVVVFFIVYQQIENHLLQPVVYGRTVQLSPLAVLISILIGAELAGILGALGAIPVAGSLQGAKFWEEAFNQAGLRGGFRAELLPEGADPMDARYNVVQWINRNERGWSVGGSLGDPRTGEILKGMARMDSHRARTDYNLSLIHI